MLSGYTAMQSMDILWFEYRNGNTLLEFSVSDQEQANELMQSELARRPHSTAELLQKG
ncbi:Uncharacterised protein [Actinobacillus pleuropneumoniae]|nr:Uncharacterised protein [Actinobacillus pleuropneumoniae]